MNPHRKIDTALLNEVRDNEELTDMTRIIRAACQEARWQGFGSDWDKARYAAYVLRSSGYGSLSGERQVTG